MLKRYSFYLTEKEATELNKVLKGYKLTWKALSQRLISRYQMDLEQSVEYYDLNRKLYSSLQETNKALNKIQASLTLNPDVNDVGISAVGEILETVNELRYMLLVKIAEEKRHDWLR